MAQAVCCDRCGKFARIEAKEVAGWYSLIETPPEGWNGDNQPRLLLCSSCKVRFEEFMKPPAVREG